MSKIFVAIRDCKGSVKFNYRRCYYYQAIFRRMSNCVMAGINRTVRSIKEFMLTGRFLSVEEGVYGM